MKDNLVTIGFIIIAVVLGFFIYDWTHEPEIVTKKIALTNFEKQKLIQDARLGYISEDSVKSITNYKTVIVKKTNWIDSLRIIDSTRINDSTVYHYENYPVYEADSSFTVEKTDSSQEVSVVVKATLKQRFLPLQEMFASDFVIDSLLINTWYKKERTLFDRIKVGPGFSIDVTGNVRASFSIIYSLN